MKYDNESIQKCPMMAEVQLSYRSKVKASDRPKISRSQDCFKYLMSIWDMDKIEHVEEAVILLLNTGNRIVGWSKVSVGGVSACYIDVKVIMQTALLANASGIIVAHNHPSGNLKPSEPDIAITKKLKQAATILDINFLDHIIVTPEDGYYSFMDEGVFI